MIMIFAIIAQPYYTVTCIHIFLCNSILACFTFILFSLLLNENVFPLHYFLMLLMFFIFVKQFDCLVLKGAIQINLPCIDLQSYIFVFNLKNCRQK